MLILNKSSYSFSTQYIFFHIVESKKKLINNKYNDFWYPLKYYSYKKLFF